MLSESLIALLNHLLAQNGWACARLAPFAGKAVRFKLFPFAVVCAIEPDGTLRAAALDTAEDAACTVSPSLLPLLALHDEAALDRVSRSGDEGLLDAVFFLARNLRWDAAEDLSRFTGDIAAERIVQVAGGAHRHARDSALNLLQALSEYWTEERPLIAKPADLGDFAHQVDELEQAMTRLEERVGRLGGSKPGAPGAGTRE